MSFALKEIKLIANKYVCIDLDGTIAHYQDWQGDAFFGEPVHGVQEALANLQKAGWKIIVFTTRANITLIRQYLEQHNIPFDYINENPEQPENAVGGKLYADAYVDDRGIQFNGDWAATQDAVLRFLPWERRNGTDAGEA
jgi:hypothetical protein